jgi:hypothetical protein
MTEAEKRVNKLNIDHNMRIPQHLQDSPNRVPQPFKHPTLRRDVLDVAAIRCERVMWLHVEPDASSDVYNKLRTGLRNVARKIIERAAV